ncbi:hypothetical protein [Actinosynnema sp. ALI-1.44]|uniref:hypothetical protein n=1 Tax=Actinosynnema sp. ALI-1.44 TaxID=1933779 RepID=UPI001178237E|nr:hypothetical protein [Actinosynnema sp. ALI-1.44]
MVQRDGEVVAQRGDWVEGPEIPDTEQAAPVKRALAIRDLALGGTRGAELLRKIERMKHEEV